MQTGVQMIGVGRDDLKVMFNAFNVRNVCLDADYIFIALAACNVQREHCIVFL